MSTYEMYKVESKGNYYTNRLAQSNSMIYNNETDSSFNKYSVKNSPVKDLSTQNLQNLQTIPRPLQNSQTELEDLKDKLKKANDVIELLRNQNQSLLMQRDSAVNQLNNVKSNESFHNENKKELEDLCNLNQSKLDVANNHISKVEGENQILKNELERLQNELYEKEQIIDRCNQEYDKLNNEMNHKLAMLEDQLKKTQNELYRTKDDYKRMQKNLGDEIEKLHNQLIEEKVKVDKLIKEKEKAKKMDENAEKLLEHLFNHYNNVSKIFTPKMKKELLRDIIEASDVEDFRGKLQKLEDRIQTLYDNYQLKFGKCFACDIACCTSRTQRLKFFSGK